MPDCTLWNLLEKFFDSLTEWQTASLAGWPHCYLYLCEDLRGECNSHPTRCFINETSYLIWFNCMNWSCHSKWLKELRRHINTAQGYKAASFKNKMHFTLDTFKARLFSITNALPLGRWFSRFEELDRNSILSSGILFVTWLYIALFVMDLRVPRLPLCLDNLNTSQVKAKPF